MSLKSFLEPVIPNLPSLSPDKEIETLRMLPAETLFLALKDANSETALWVMENAKANQIQGVIDLDCWQADNFLPERFFRYFEFMTYTTPEKLSEFTRDLDPEVIVLSLMEVVDVSDFDPQNPPEAQEASFILSPDSKYILTLKTQDPNLKERLIQWMNKMSHADMNMLRRHLESIKWESKSDAEEFAYQIKKGRIEELGFVEKEEAVQFYSYDQAPRLKKDLLENPLKKEVKEDTPLLETIGSESFLPQPLSKAMQSDGFFRDSVQLIENHHLVEMLRMELVRTINAVFTADDVLSSDLEVLKASAARTRQYLDLGLLYLCSGNKEIAKEQLAVQSVFNIARLGWVLIQDMAKTAKEIREKFPMQLFESIDRELLNALKGKHPDLAHPALIEEFSLNIEKPFLLETIHKIADRIGSLAILAPFFNVTLSASLALEKTPLTALESAWTRLSTGLFRQASSLEFSAEPLSLEEFNAAQKNFNSDLFAKLATTIESKVPELARPVFRLHLDRRLEEINNVIKSGKSPDKRYFHAVRIA